MKRRDFLGVLATAPLLSALPRAAFADTPIVAANYGKIPAPHDIKRVVAAGPPAGTLLCTLVPEKFLGWSMELPPVAMEYVSPELRTRPYVGRIGGRGATSPIEALLKMNPDVIIDIGEANDLYREMAERTHRQTGVPYVLVDGRLPEHAEQFIEIGKLLGAGERAKILAAYTRKVLDTAIAVRESVSREKQPRIYYARGVDGLESGRKGAINIEVLEFVGGRNVTDAAGEGGMARFSMEQLLIWNPEIIITQDAVFARQVMTNPRWRSIDAVKNGRVHLAPIYPFGWIDGPPSVNRLIGVIWLQSLLFPNHPLVEKDVHGATQAFYKLFYGADLTPDLLNRLFNRT